MSTCRNLLARKYYGGENVSLKYKDFYSCDETYDHVSSVWYDIYSNNPRLKVGSIDLRLTMNDHMFYYGHIGYHILEKYRGHHYAYEACKLLFKIAKEEFLMKELIITCNPDNIASRKTLERLGCVLEEIVDVPVFHELNYHEHELQKCIYRIKL